MVRGPGSNGRADVTGVEPALLAEDRRHSRAWVWAVMNGALRTGTAVRCAWSVGPGGFERVD